jgi:hypothetical protein
VLLRPYSHLADEQMPPEDLWTFQKIGAKGTEITGYPNASAYHEFRYHPKEVITGDFDSWMYDHRGVYAWTVEIWSPQRQAGIGDYKFIEWYREHPLDDDLKLMKWNDTVLKGKGFVDWYAFDHPQLGRVELAAGTASTPGLIRRIICWKGNRAVFALVCGTRSSRRGWTFSRPPAMRWARMPGTSDWWCRTAAGCRLT